MTSTANRLGAVVIATVLMVGLGAAPASAAKIIAASGTRYVLDEKVALRRTPSNSAPNLRTLDSGSRVVITGKTGSWVRVKQALKTGFVPSATLTAVRLANATGSRMLLDATKVTAPRNPKLTGLITRRTAPIGTFVRLLAKRADGRRVKVGAGSWNGWIAASALAPPGVSRMAGTRHAARQVAVTKGVSAASKELLTLSKGQAVKIYGVKGKRAYVKRGTVKGWTARSALQAQFKVGTFNLRYEAYASPWPWEKRAPLVARDIIASGSAVVAAQEVNKGTYYQAEDVVKALNARTASANPWAKENAATNLAFFWDRRSAEKLTKVTYVAMFKDSSISLNRRHMAYAKFRISGRDVWIISFHGPVRAESTTGDTAALYSAAASSIAGLAKSLANTAPVVIAGDMNDGASFPQQVVARGFGDVRAMVPASGISGGNLCSFNGFRPNMEGCGPGWWIDGIFISRDIRALDIDMVVTYANGNSLPLATPIPSDHFLVYAHLGLAA